MFNSSSTSEDRDNRAAEIVRLRGLIESKDNIISSFNKQIHELRIKIDSVKDYILSLNELGEEIPDDLISITELLDISLTKQYAVEVQVIYRGNVEIPFDADIRDLQKYVEFDFAPSQKNDWEVDLFQYDVYIDYREA